MSDLTGPVRRKRSSFQHVRPILKYLRKLVEGGAGRRSAIAVMGIDIGKNSFHVVGLDGRGAVALRQRWSRGQEEARLANMPPCLIGMEACVGAYLSRRLRRLGHDARLMPAKYVRPYSKGQKNDFRDAEIAEAVQRNEVRCHGDRPSTGPLGAAPNAVVSQQTGIINQIRPLPLGAWRCAGAEAHDDDRGPPSTNRSFNSSKWRR